MNALWGGNSASSHTLHNSALSTSAAAEDREYEKLGAKWFTQYFCFVECHGKKIFYFWCVFLFVSMLYGPRFLTMGDDRVDAPEGTAAYFAEQEFEARFQAQATEIPMLILIRITDNAQNEGVDITDPRLSTFANKLHSTVLEYNSTVENIRSMISYYSMRGTLLDSAKDAFVNKDKTATFMNIMVSGEQITFQRYEFVSFLRGKLDELNPNPKDFFIGLTGIDAMLSDTTEVAEKNMIKTDAFSVPLAMGLLGFMIHSWRLLIFSFINMGVAILGSFAIMAFAVDFLGAPNPESASAQLMEVIALAVSIDWSLFLHRRYRDEIKQGADARKAAYLALLHSGHVVVMSGATLWVVFVAFLALPAATVQMDGACCAMGVTVALLVTLTNTPAVWLAFPHFSSNFNNQLCRTKTMEELNIEAARMGLVDDNQQEAYLDEPLLSGTASSSPNLQQINTGGSLAALNEEDSDETATTQSSSRRSSAAASHHVMYSGPRFRFTRWVTKFPNNVFSIILVYLLVIPFAFQVKDIVLNQDILASMPRGSKSAQTFKRAFENFPGGTFSPMYVLVTSKSRADRNVVLQPKFFEVASACSKRLYEVSKKMDPEFTESSFMAPVYLEGREITLTQARAFLKLAESKDCNLADEHKVKHPTVCSVAKSYEFAWKQSVNVEQNAMLISITVPFFPFASESSAYIDLVNQVLEEFTNRYPKYDFYVSGVVVGFDAMQRRVVALFPRLLITTFLIVFVILGYLLRSLFVPVRLALTLVAPLCAVFGSAVLVYQKGALEWMGWQAVGRMDGFYWYIPILLLSMIIGLSLDWDVLLVSRIMEHRENGYDIQASICKAVCETGGTISVAGIIMCLAFGGMMLSDQMMINACGFILTLALLLDTFLVNTTLVPALISIGDRVAWFPARMPHDNLKTLENCDEFPKD